MKTTNHKPWILAQNKALAHGVKSLNLDELLHIIGAPHRKALATPTFDAHRDGLRRLNQCSIGEFSEQYQMGIELACKLAASLELGTRHWCKTPERGQTLNDPQQVQHWLRTQLRDRDREVFACVYLDNKHRLIHYEELFIGDIDSAEVYPRVVVQQCLRYRACAVIFIHNHPSGNPEPSAADHALTQRLKQALNLVDIRVLDHFIVADNQFTGFAERGWL